MNSEKYFNDIYKDFFGDYEERKKNLENLEKIKGKINTIYSKIKN